LVLIAIVLFGLLAWSGQPLLAAPSSQDDQLVITSLSDGSTVSGVVQIIGSVTHPNFYSYGLFYAAGPVPTGDSQWVQLVFDVMTPVSNGVLATWDTTALAADGQPAVPNGMYTLTLVRYRQGITSPDQIFIRNVTVNNQAGQETPTPTPTPTLPPLQTADASIPTNVPVEQPPTFTPMAPGTTPQPGETPEMTPGGEEETGVAIDTGRLRGAFLDGAKVTLLLFFLWGLYIAARAVVRYLLRTRQFELPWKK